MYEHIKMLKHTENSRKRGKELSYTMKYKSCALLIPKVGKLFSQQPKSSDKPEWRFLAGCRKPIGSSDAADFQKWRRSSLKLELNGSTLLLYRRHKTSERNLSIPREVLEISCCSLVPAVRTFPGSYLLRVQLWPQWHLSGYLSGLCFEFYV